MSIFYNDVILFIEKEVTYEALQKAKQYKVEHGKYPTFEEFLRWKEMFFKVYMNQLKRKLREADVK